MPKPKNKSELLQQSQENWVKMWQLIDGMNEEMQIGTFHFAAEAGKEAHWGRDRNIRDNLAHLYEWQLLLLKWVQTNESGDGKVHPFLPAPYNWKNYGTMNVEFWKKHQQTSLEEAKALLQESHQSVISLIERFSDEELYTKKFFSWTGTSSLAAYCQSAAASHYDWAIKKLRMHQKTFDKT